MESVPLALAKGERADFIRCPETGIPLGIHENWNGSFSALPPVDTELDSRIDDLTLDDLRVRAIDWPELLLRVQRELRLDGRLRPLSFKPPLWHLGAGDAQTCFFSILDLVEDVWEVVPFL
ncbi:MAG: hypothetical protein U9P12_09775, partial [Verrucomicrobiota bacterium]|nr:hypothetical protein [Verrucomicrobiota bacterium]